MKLETSAEEHAEQTGITDDRLRLIFTCCHPALAPDPKWLSLFARSVASRLPR